MTEREKELLGHIAVLLAMVQREKGWRGPCNAIEAIEKDVGFTCADAVLARTMRILDKFQRRDDVEGDADQRAKR